MPTLTAAEFIERLNALQSDEEREKLQKFFKTGAGQYAEGTQFMGVKMGHLFDLAKEFVELDLREIETLLDNPIHEVKAGALSIMEKQAMTRRRPQARRKELYDLYLRRHDRINNWDLVDLAAHKVIGAYILDYQQPRDILTTLALSENLWERRTAMVATAPFIKKGETQVAFQIAELLLNDTEDMIHKPAGGWIRQAGKTDKAGLIRFLDQHAAIMPRTMLRFAIEHLSREEKEHYMWQKRELTS